MSIQILAYDNSDYYKKVIKVFNGYPDEASKRAYVSAIVQCFHLNDGKPLAPTKIAEDYGFNKYKLHEFGFVLAKSHATAFLINSVNHPGLTASDIRNIGVTQYKTTFGREPFIRGQSRYWFSLSEWMYLLGARG